MKIGNRLLAMLSTAALSFSASAARVEIDAKGGVIPNDATAEVAIISATGSGSGITTAAGETKIATLSQEQGAVVANVNLATDGSLALGGIVVAPSANSLIIGTGSHLGVLQASTNAVGVTVSANAEVTVNADFTLGSKVLGKYGLGTVTMTGDFCGTVEQNAGELAYRDSANAYGVRVAANDNASYQFASSGDLADQLANRPLGLGGLKSESVIYGGTASKEVPLSEFEVNGGSVVRSSGARLLQYRLYKGAEEYVHTVPGCGAVGTNSVGVLKLDGGSYYGKLAVGMGDKTKAKGVVRVYNGAVVDNFASMDSNEWLFGVKGYAFLDVNGGTYRAHGNWNYGSEGQAMINVVNGSFGLGSSGESAWHGGMSLGGSDSKVTFYVGAGGSVKVAGDESRDIYFGSNNARVQVTVDAGAKFDVGSNEINYSGSDTTVFNVRNGGSVVSSGYRRGGGSSQLQFDNGSWRFPCSTDRGFGGAVYIYEGGATIDVDEDCEVTMAYRIEAPTGKGVEAIGHSAIAEIEFLGPPAIEITGSGGKGATAVCDYNPDTRRVTGIRVTGRGFGYNSATAKAYYGNSQYDLGIVTLSENKSGALVKAGSGTLVLTKECTYEGVTRIESGTLKVDEESALANSAGVSLCGGFLDLSEVKTATVKDLKGDGTGEVLDGGKLIVTSLTCDLMNGISERVPETLNLKNVAFGPGASIKLANIDGLDASATYTLYLLKNYGGEGFPRLDATVYDTLSRRWGVSVEDDKVVMKCYDGSLFIYY